MSKLDTLDAPRLAERLIALAAYGHDPRELLAAAVADGLPGGVASAALRLYRARTARMYSA